MPATDPTDAPGPPPSPALPPEDLQKLTSILTQSKAGIKLGSFPFFHNQAGVHLNCAPSLRSLPTASSRTLISASEYGPAFVDLGDNLALSFSLQPPCVPSGPAPPLPPGPSAIATLLRAILTLGTRPLASAHLGPSSSPTRFLEGPLDSPGLVNEEADAFWLGLLPHDQASPGRGAIAGDGIFCIGAAGTAFPSGKPASPGVESASGGDQAGSSQTIRPEAAFTRELLATHALVLGLTDLSPSAPTVGSAAPAPALGIEIDLDRLPRGGSGPTPVEILLGHSTEHVLTLVRQDRDDDLKALLARWDLPAARVGQLTDSGHFVVRNQDLIVVDLPLTQPCAEAGSELTQIREPEHLAMNRAFTLTGLPDTQDPARDLKTMLSDPAFAPRRWICGHDTPLCPSETAPSPILDSAAFTLREDLPPGDDEGLAQAAPRSRRERRIGLAFGATTDHGHLDPYAAGKMAVAEASRNLACVGASPLCAITILRLGDALPPDSAWRCQEFLRAMSEGCRAFHTPVTDSRIHFSPASPTPTPQIALTFAMAGLISQADPIPTPWFKDPGDAILLLGDPVEDRDPLLGLGGSAYLRLVHHLNAGTPPNCDLEKEKELHLALRALICSGAVKSAHDCAEGGLALALLESCVVRPPVLASPEPIGAQVDLTSLTATPPPTPPTATPSSPQLPQRLDAWLFGEAQARVLISVAPLDAAKVLAQAAILGVPASPIGAVGGSAFQVKTPAGELKCDLAELAILGWKPPRA